MPPKGGKKTKGGTPISATPLALYKGALAAIRAWSPVSSSRADADALLALGACAQQLQARMGLAAGPAAATDPDGSSASSGGAQPTSCAEGGQEDALLAPVWPLLEQSLAVGAQSYGAVVRHSLDLELDDWEDEPGFLLACAHFETGERVPRRFAYPPLRNPVLHYPLDPLLDPSASPSASTSASSTSSSSSSAPGHERYVRAVDGALPPALLGALRSALSPGSSFWREHGYGRVGYFSYMHQLGSPALSAVHQAATLLHRIVAQRFPAAAEARYAEWAHCRRHPSGHQLHFDSDDEGEGGVRNPIVSTVIYLTGGVGGPTLVTPQLLGGPLAQHGWLVHPRENRLGMFTGDVLHGVVPGRGPSPRPGEHRITLMVAFWRDIQCRPRGDGLPGPTQPFPTAPTAAPDASPTDAAAGAAAAAASVPASCPASHSSATGCASGSGPGSGAPDAPGSPSAAAAPAACRYTWMTDLAPHPGGLEGWGAASPVDVAPTPIARVWERADGGEAQPGAVQYDACFQGF
ncbi:hypothetical protein TSOC_006722 [Tetrabaena socialis]|uniref:Uncharacterized protein n=1 Tax=Tetrabaena socialis TaxID=47790 RepID=A0A2J8A2Y0_9CHLO|nr:hypothetical protein TSOC_006722 [Tetrabaena socialis]|eukprot:PNH06875.1 hypothetical protein TSOC_006722 [Tetrabaena socialis]